MLTVQEYKKIACLGGDFTFSHIATCKLFNLDYTDKSRLIQCKTLQNVVLAVQAGEADFGLVPFWNTSRHKIIEAQETIIKSPNVFIVKNFKMDVNLCLLSPLSSVDQIEKVRTISHVIKQVSQWRSGLYVISPF